MGNGEVGIQQKLPMDLDKYMTERTGPTLVSTKGGGGWGGSRGIMIPKTQPQEAAVTRHKMCSELVGSGSREGSTEVTAG